MSAALRICALALATDGGIAGERSPSSAVVGRLVAGWRLSAPTLPDLRCAYFFQWCEPCLAYLLSATGVPAVSDFAAAAASSAPAAACDGPAKHTKSPVASINAERPLALMVIALISPFASPRREKRPRGVSAAGQKKGIFGQYRAKTGQRPRGRERFRIAASPWYRCDRVPARTDRCYEPDSEPGRVVAIPGSGRDPHDRRRPGSRLRDHELPSVTN